MLSFEVLIACKWKNANDNWQKDLLTLSCKNASNSGTNIFFLDATAH